MLDIVETKFGSIASLKVLDDPERVQVIHFDREGSDHTHPRWEHAVCLSGDCDIIIEGWAHPAGKNKVHSIAPGMPHRMRPTTDEPSVWLIWYSDSP